MGWLSRYVFTCDPAARPDWVKSVVTYGGIILIVWWVLTNDVRFACIP